MVCDLTIVTVDNFEHPTKATSSKYSLDDEADVPPAQSRANSIDLWNQEYPTGQEVAFLTTGRPVFNPEQLQQCTELPVTRRRPSPSGDEWVNNAGTTTTKLDPERYVIG